MFIRFYLSTNDYISSSDIIIGGAAWIMPSGSIVTTRAQITILRQCFLEYATSGMLLTYWRIFLRLMKRIISRL